MTGYNPHIDEASYDQLYHELVNGPAPQVRDDASDVDEMLPPSQDQDIEIAMVRDDQAQVAAAERVAKRRSKGDAKPRPTIGQLIMVRDTRAGKRNSQFRGPFTVTDVANNGGTIWYFDEHRLQQCHASYVKIARDQTARSLSRVPDEAHLDEEPQDAIEEAYGFRGRGRKRAVRVTWHGHLPTANSWQRWSDLSPDDRARFSEAYTEPVDEGTVAFDVRPGDLENIEGAAYRDYRVDGEIVQLPYAVYARFHNDFAPDTMLIPFDCISAEIISDFSLWSHCGHGEKVLQHYRESYWRDSPDEGH